MNLTASHLTNGTVVRGRVVAFSAAAIACGLLLANFPLPFVLGISAVIVAAALLLRPDLATLLFVFALYANVQAVAVRYHGVPSIAAAATIGLLLLPLAHQLLLQRREIVLPKITVLIVLFATVQIVSAVWAGHRETAVKVVLTTVLEGLVLFLLLVNVIRTPKMLRLVMWTLIMAGTFLSGIAVVQRATGSPRNNFKGFARLPKNDRADRSSTKSSPRATGPIGEKNYFAQFLLMLIPLALFRLWNEHSPRLRLLAAISAGLILAGIALTESRGAVFGMAAMLAALLAMRCLSIRQIGVIAVTGVLVVLSSPGYRERLADLSGLAEIAQDETSIRRTDKSLQGRLSEIVAAALIFRENPLIGVGPGNFPTHFLEKANALGFQIHGEERLAHCAILEIAAETGILGVLCIVAIFAVMIRELLAARRATVHDDVRAMIDASLVVLIVLATTSLFLSFAFVRYYWLMLAVAAVAARLGFQNAADPSEKSPSTA